MSPLDSSGSTAESYTSDTTLSAGSPTHQFSSSHELNDSGQLATPFSNTTKQPVKVI